MGMAQLVVTAVLVEGRGKSELARTYGVSRRWVITLVQRFLAEGEDGLQPRSRRPHRSPARTGQAVEDEIVALRKELDRGPISAPRKGCHGLPHDALAGCHHDYRSPHRDRLLGGHGWAGTKGGRQR
jgi:hypothetical protein